MNHIWKRQTSSCDTWCSHTESDLGNSLYSKSVELIKHLSDYWNKKNRASPVVFARSSLSFHLIYIGALRSPFLFSKLVYKIVLHDKIASS
ncbi:hypothetical protein PHG25p015nc [Aeromonas phage 25]|uniref:Uncharacterized protein n=1 Tax=Aeromonas phage 25 TaxID=2911441 RepID=Q19D04_9CAUD|nr:hypothetical protein PHG25p015nc [Aeromonas phage 25]ABF72799.1 hypothetical protein PHG25p015nc [Aeromonas phage 25]